MRIEAFHIPAIHACTALEKLNNFIESHQVIHVDQRWVEDGINSFWAVLVRYHVAAPDGDDDASKAALKSDSKQRTDDARIDYRSSSSFQSALSTV